MAIRYLCDGCDKEVPYDLVQNVSVRIKIKGQTSEHCGDYELCKSCTTSMVSHASPKNWTRCGPAPRKIA